MHRFNTLHNLTKNFSLWMIALHHWNKFHFKILSLKFVVTKIKVIIFAESHTRLYKLYKN